VGEKLVTPVLDARQLCKLLKWVVGTSGFEPETSAGSDGYAVVRRHGDVLLGQPNPLLHGVDQRVSLAVRRQHGGQRVRFSIANSALFATVTTDARCVAVNSMHDRFMPLGGMVPMANILLGEIVFGGCGGGPLRHVGFRHMAVFIAGLMVGRTPEYLGKKIQAYNVQMSMLYLLIFPFIILGFTAVAALMPNLGLSSVANHRPHGLSEIFYAYTSATGNNGSAFAGLNANIHWYNYSPPSRCSLAAS
jgi:K+-transporting ATPase ATPase A chain